MRHPQAFLTCTGVTVAGLLVAACGATHSSTSTVMIARPAHTANVAAHARIVFLSPRAGARVGSTVHVRVRRSMDGRVRFILDGHRDQVTGAAATVFRHVTPGRHRLQAELLVTPGHTSAATAVVRFQVRRPPPPPPAMTVTAPVPPVTTQAAPAPPVTTQAAPAPSPPAPTQTQTTMSAPAPPTGIPQNGGGDDDSDNHGAPSDGDGNL